MNEIENKIKALFISSIEFQLLDEEIQIDGDFEGYGANSINFIKFVVSIESEFDIAFDDEDLDYRKFPNIKSVASYVQSKLEKKANE